MLRSVLQVLHHLVLFRPWGEQEVSLRNLGGDGAVEASNFVHPLFTEVKFATAHRHDLLLQGHVRLLHGFFEGVFEDVEALRCLILLRCNLTVAICVVVETITRIRIV